MMKKLIALFACILFTGVLLALPAKGTAQTKDSSPEVEQNKQLFESKCQQCHSLERVKKAHLDRDKAKVVVERMRQKPGANISKGEAESIYEYLGNYFIIPPSPPVAPAPIQ
jgi:cytochrome c2